MRTRHALTLLAATLTITCSRPLEGQALVAAQADRATRQLVAGLNAQSRDALRTLIVLTSSTGAVRNPTASEMSDLLTPEGPFEALGPGRPGTVHLRDGAGRKQAVRLIPFRGDLRVLGVREPLVAAMAHHVPTDTQAIQGLSILTIMQRERALE